MIIISINEYQKRYEELQQRYTEQFSIYPPLLENFSMLLRLLWNKSDGLTKSPVIISLHELTDTADSRIYQGQMEHLIETANDFSPKLKASYQILYNQAIAVLTLGGISVQYEVVLDLPYGQREKTYQFLFEINQLIKENGALIVFINNMVYNLEFKVFISATSNIEQVKKLIEQSGWKSDGKQGYKELFNDAMVLRKYKVTTLPYISNYSYFRELIELQFQFRSETELEEKGYHLRERTESLHIFISYSHKDKQFVYPLVGALDDAGLNVWIDRKNIDVGDNILNSVAQGLKEHDLGIVFLSKNYLTSSFSQFELSDLLREMIVQQKNIFPVKLDDVNVEDVFHGLGGYKYYDYTEFPELEQFVVAVKRKLSVIQKE